jgi:hypothetical protein
MAINPATWAKPASTIFRELVTEGQSTRHKPVKAEVRTWGADVEAVATALHTIAGSGKILGGLTLSTNGAQLATVAAGSALAGGMVLSLASTMSKSLAAAWQAGNGNGGLDTGSEASNTWYYVWLIGNLTTGATDVLLSVSPTSPTMPSGWAAKRYLGGVYNNASSNLKSIVNAGDYFTWTDGPSQDFSLTGISSGSRSLFTLNLPLVPVYAQCAAHFYFSTTGTVHITSPDWPDNAADVTQARAAMYAAGTASLQVSQLDRYTATRQLAYRFSAGSSNQIYIGVMGWTDLQRAG